MGHASTDPAAIRCEEATSERRKSARPRPWYRSLVFLADAPLTFREFVTHEEVPLASIFREVLEFLAGRPDAVIFGAHAVNAYCDPVTHDVDVLSTRANELAEELRARLAERL